jgi:hypothetical protein
VTRVETRLGTRTRPGLSVPSTHSCRTPCDACVRARSRLREWVGLPNGSKPNLTKRPNPDQDYAPTQANNRGEAPAQRTRRFGEECDRPLATLPCPGVQAARLLATRPSFLPPVPSRFYDTFPIGTRNLLRLWRL